MKNAPIPALLLLCLATVIGLTAMAQTQAPTASNSPVLHEFRGTNGRVFKGQLTDFADPQVFGTEENGTPFEVAIDQFSPADQTYIRDWALKRVVKDLGSLIRFDVVEKNSTDQVNDSNTERNGLTTSREKLSTVSRWKSDYKVTMENKTQDELSNVNVVYNIFRQDSNKTIRSFVGSNQVASLAPAATTTFISSQVEMEFVSNATETTTANIETGTGESGTKSSVDDQMLIGIWIKAYDSKGTLLAEWCSNPDLQKTQTWKNPAKRATPAAERRAPAREAPSGQ